jgi:hypothetical protein
VPLGSTDCRKCRNKKQKEWEWLEAREYTSSSNCESEVRSKRGKKKGNAKDKKKGKKVEIMTDREMDSSGSGSEQTVIIKKVSQHKASNESKNKGRDTSHPSSAAGPPGAQGQASGYQQPSGPAEVSHSHYEHFILGVPYPVSDSGTGN